MSVYANGAVAQKIIRKNIRIESKTSWVQWRGTVDFDTYYGIAISAAIWAGFFVSFWTL